MVKNILEQTFEICASLNDPTLIFCKSAASAYNLAQSLIEKSITNIDLDLDQFSNWLETNYHPDWVFSKFLKKWDRNSPRWFAKICSLPCIKKIHI